MNMDGPCMLLGEDDENGLAQSRKQGRLEMLVVTTTEHHRSLFQHVPRSGFCTINQHLLLQGFLPMVAITFLFPGRNRQHRSFCAVSSAGEHVHSAASHQWPWFWCVDVNNIFGGQSLQPHPFWHAYIYILYIYIIYIIIYRIILYI